MDEKTLEGTRKKLYQLLKVIKYCTGSTAKSYECKFAIHMTFLNIEPKEEHLGLSLMKAMEHHLIKGSFDGVRKELRDVGIEDIVLRENCVEFLGNSEILIFLLPRYGLILGSQNTQPIMEALKLSLLEGNGQE